MAWQPVRLRRQPGKPGPAAGERRAAAHRLDVAPHLARVPALAAAGNPFKLRGREPQHLAQLADRAARAVGREGGHQRRPVGAEALGDTRNQHLADVAREVQVDVGQRLQVLAQEAPDRKPVGDRIHV